MENSNSKVCTASLKLLGDFWTVMIVSQLANGPARFRDLEKNIENANSATLSNRLKTMHKYKLVTRTEHTRADVDYELTELGKQVLPVIGAVNNFSEMAYKAMAKDKAIDG